MEIKKCAPILHCATILEKNIITLMQKSAALPTHNCNSDEVMATLDILYQFVSLS